MARYDYQCSICQQVQEKILSMASDPTEPLYCDQCGRNSMRRLLSTGLGFNSGQLARDARWPVVSDALPLNLDGMRHDEAGRPIIENRRQAKDLGRRYGFEWR